MRAFITGAATGIGAAVVEKLKARNYEVVALDIVEPSGVDQWIHVDMSDPDSIDAAVNQLTGSFDCLICNAGVPPREGLEEAILSVNYLGLVRCTNAVLPLLKTQASVVHTASRAGHAWRDNLEQVKQLMTLTSNAELASFIDSHGINHVRAYNLSKEALIVWSMAQTQKMIEMDLRMNTVSPAAVSTGILDDFALAFGERMAKNVARAGRPGTAEEIADVIVFMCSEQSRWMKGMDITIDGGMSALAQVDALAL